MAINPERYDSKLVSQSEAVGQILKMLDEIKFGSVEIIIHDSKITQIERREKVRPVLQK